MDQDKKILKKSKQRLQKLRLLSNFFDKTELISIIIKTELIQSYFDTSSPNDLDINKLELFHLQYTDSLITLLEKIKKQKEAQILAVYKEIDANRDFIDSYVSKEAGKKSFSTDKKYQNALMSEFLKTYYGNLTDIRKELNIKKIRDLSNNYAVEYYRKTAKLEFLLSLPSSRYYNFDNVDVERKLLGKLNSNNFKVRFVCGYNVNNQVFELYQISATADDFIWNLQTNEFYFLADDIAVLLDRTPNASATQNIADDLSQRNEELKENAEKMKTELPGEVLEILQKYKETLDNQEIINQVINVDEEMNILNSMLNLNLNNKLQ